MCMVVAKCIHGFYSIIQDSCYTYMDALHYSYGRMQCINMDFVYNFSITYPDNLVSILSQ